MWNQILNITGGLSLQYDPDFWESKESKESIVWSFSNIKQSGPFL